MTVRRRVQLAAGIVAGVVALIVTTSAAAVAMQSAGATTAPLFTADLAGFIKIVSIIVGVVLLPLGALNVYFLKSRSDAKVAEVRADHDRDIEALRLEHARDLAAARSEIGAFRAELNGFGGRTAAVESGIAGCGQRISSLNDILSTDRQEIMQAIYAGSEQHVRAVHEVELKVAGVSSRNDLGPCLTEFGKSIEKLAGAMMAGNEKLVAVVLEHRAQPRNGGGAR